MQISSNWIILITISVILSSVTFIMVSGFKSLPAPLFGGDIYYQHGAIEHILQGGDPLKSSSILGGIPGYLPFYGICVSAFSMLFGLGAFKGMLLFSVIIAFVVPLVWAFLIKDFVDDEKLCVIGAVLAVLFLKNILSFPVLKYTDFTFVLMLPLFLISLHRSFRDFSLQNAILLAFFYSILSLSHMVAFIGASAMLASVAALRAFTSFRARRSLKSLAENNWKAGVAFLVVSLPILAIYWYEPVFTYHLRMSYDRTHMDLPDVQDFSIQVWFVLNVLQLLFLNTSSLAALLGSAFFIFALYSLLKNMGRMEDYRLQVLATLLIASLLATFSYFLTEPLLKMNFIPSYMYWMTISPVLLLLGLHFLDKTKIAKTVLGSGSLFLVTLAVLILLAVFTAAESQKSSELFNYSKNPLRECRLSLIAFVESNTSVNDVFLSTKEMGFMVNALSGRKVVTNRWAHQNDPYTNMPQRDIDAAIMLFGDNYSKRAELMEQYRVKYVYWDSKWMEWEYQFPANGGISPMDPLMTLDTPQAREQFDSNGIKYANLSYWIEPAVKDWYIRQFPLLLVSPENYRSYEQPWQPPLDDHLTKVWSCEENGKPVSAIYRYNPD